LEAEGVEAEYFGKVDIEGAVTLEALRMMLETNEILEWPFEFRDVEDKQRIRKKLKHLNDIYVVVHAIWLGKVDRRWASRQPKCVDHPNMAMK